MVALLYPDPTTGYPPQYARDHIPKILEYPGGQSAPPMTGLNFTPGQLLGCVSGELGLRQFLEAGGHELVVTSDMYVDCTLFRLIVVGRGRFRYANT